MNAGVQLAADTFTLESPVVRLGRKVSEIVEREKLTLRAVADKATESAWFLFGKEDYGITANRLSKLMEAYKGPKATGSAKWVRDWELASLAHALDFSLDDVLGSDLLKQQAIFWDALASPRYALEVLTLMRRHQDRNKEMWGWGQYLPCSLETPAFMKAHHQAIFEHIPGATEGEQNTVIDAYNQIGTLRRDQFLKARTWKMNTVILLSDLHRIASRTGEYRKLSGNLIKECFSYLTTLVIDPKFKLCFAIVDDDEVGDLLPFLEDSDSRLLIGDTFALWRDRRGNITWSENKRIITQQKALFSSLLAKATWKKPEDVAKKLRDLQRAGRRQ